MWNKIVEFFTYPIFSRNQKKEYAIFQITENGGDKYYIIKEKFFGNYINSYKFPTKKFETREYAELVLDGYLDSLESEKIKKEEIIYTREINL